MHSECVRESLLTDLLPRRTAASVATTGDALCHMHPSMDTINNNAVIT